MIQLGPIRASTTVLPIGSLRMTTVGRKGCIVTLMTSRKSGMITVMLTTNTGIRSKVYRHPKRTRKVLGR